MGLCKAMLTTLEGEQKKYRVEEPYSEDTFAGAQLGK